MVLKVSFVLALAFVIAHGHDISNVLKLDLPKEIECTAQGLMCDSCKHLVYCYKNTNGDWIKEIANICLDSETCNSSTYPPSCSSSANVECDITGDVKITCNQVGMFPHPYDCTRYYICITDNEGMIDPSPLQYICERGYGYDPLTTLCRNALVSGRCDKRPVEMCTGFGIKAVQGNPYLYAACLSQNTNEGRVVFNPHIFICPNNHRFIETSCVKPVIGVDEENKCIASGNFYDPQTCDQYKECDGLGSIPIVNKCPDGHEFNSITRECEIFTCI